MHRAGHIKTRYGRPYLVYFWTKLHEILAPCLESNIMTFSTFLHSEETLTTFGPPPPRGAGGRGVKNLGNGWSISIVLENKVVINFDFWHGAKQTSHLDYPLQSYGQIYFDIF